MTDPIAALRSLFVERCRTDLDELGRLLERRDVAGVGDIVHRIAGAAGSFGFPEISAAALVVDQQIRNNEEAREADLEQLLGLLAELEA
ncbi:MAG: Hpt domain-containing protein [Brevundimonas sp.]|uniref:Hpt domain-containing protein n=1 Tax=Brevundimonas sp. TaxID=1871086 RepID=UPI002AB9FDB4|nr:Hpt domain-containing protein [Brevundimonas sp.]MDZ4113705.1 Hpt domain-containing protein [Brevundimonas sp.]